MYKKRKKIIAIKDCSITRRPNILQQLIHQNYTELYNRRYSTLGDDLVERQRQLHACTHRGCLMGMCPLRSWKFFIFKTEIVQYGGYKRKLRLGDE